MRRVVGVVVVFLAGSLIGFPLGPARDAAGATLPVGFSEALVVSDLQSPTAMAFAPDGHLFVCEKGGRLRVIRDGTLLATPFITLAVNSLGERGLLGVAFDPAFGSNRYVYVYYTATTPTIHNRVSRFTANGDVAVPGSEVVILNIDPLTSAPYHNGGAIHFGPDGKLYVAVGDNASSSNSQWFTTLKGKMLRINRDGSIPTDNPFYGTASGVHRAIWALGLRNPFTFAFHAQSGDMLINDVGANAWEEINDGRRGANYGWPATEGYTSNPAYVSPVYAYAHGTTSTTGCAITGGAFYDPEAFTFPAGYASTYFFGDYCGGWIRRLNTANNTVSSFATGVNRPVDLKVSRDGQLYYLTLGGRVYRVAYNQAAPSISVQPASRTVQPGSSVTFSVTANGAPILRYQWQRNGSPISGATSSSLYLASVTSNDNGARFRVVVRNDYGSVTSQEAVLTVTDNRRPTASISQPTVGTLYRGGATISYAGSASDPEDGTLPASAFSWTIVFHHNTHTHPFLGPIAGVKSGAFVIPTSGETSANVWYRIRLTVTDRHGATSTTYRDLLPQKVRLTLATSPSGLGLALDGQPIATPVTFDAVVGIVRTLSAPTPQTRAGVSWQFSRWSDGGAREHKISTPAVNTTYTATYTSGLATGTGTGLSAQYFNNIDFTALAVARIDPTVNFDWGDGAPAASINADTFSVRWTGRVQARSTETYTFYVQSDEGVRLWVNGHLLIDDWTAHTVRERQATMALTRGQTYNIRIDYYERSGRATIRLRWSTPSISKQVVPKSQLYLPGTS